MPPFQISLTRPKQVGGRFIATVRRELQKAFAEEQASRGLTQSAIAVELGVNRSVIHRQLLGLENLTLGTVGEIASALGREPYFTLSRPATQAFENYFVPTSSLGLDGKLNSSPISSASAGIVNSGHSVIFTATSS